MPANRRTLPARYSIAVRHHGPRSPEAAAAGRELAERNLAEQIRAAVDSWPQLTAAQRRRLAVLLRPGDGDSDE